MSERQATGDWAGRSGPGPASAPVVPGYELLDELGRGGMGVVYRARQPSSGRLVALKLIRDGALAGPQDRIRFRIEAEASMRMHHPNIVAIYEVGTDESRPFIAMELVEGGGLDQHLSGRPHPAAHAANFIRTLALAVHHAHTQKIVHRDLKPANILLRIADCRLQIDKQEVGGPDQSAISNLQSAIPMVTDFGLAKRLDTDSTALTKEGAVLGTAGYMAPEQAAGRVREVGPAVDVYALGAILYELLTGRPPFEGESWNEAIQQVIHNEPVPPTRLWPDVPRALETVCLKCLEKDPGRRYVSAEELADDLQRFLDGKPVAAAPPNPRERLARLAARDGYEIRDEIGRGPRSVVYRALYGSLQQPVAVKVFSPGVVTHDAWEARLRRHAELSAGLTHPQLVPVQRAGWWDDAPYVALEYVPHGSLADRLAGRPYPVAQTLLVAEQLAEIVSYLHRQGVVHGNLKPGNVLLAAGGIPRLGDLHWTGGAFLGELPDGDADPAGLAYVPPERIDNPGGEPRFFTDIYGLGIILYELLTGRPAFTAATARQARDQVRNQDPVPLSQINARVLPPVEAVCLRCLARNPWRRFARAFDLLTALRHCRAELERQAPPNPRRPRTIS